MNDELGLLLFAKKCAELAYENKYLKTVLNDIKNIVDNSYTYEYGAIIDIEKIFKQNEVLKQALDKEPLAQKALVTAYSSYKKQVIELYKVLDSYKQTLQEIKAIAESAIAKQQEYKKDFEQILDLITKAEEE